MKKQIIGALVGGLILFIWQFMTWGLLELHGSAMQYTPNQDAILEVLDANLTEEGTYFIPRMDASADEAAKQAYYQERAGKPWAMVSYHKELNNNMTMNMVRGFVIDFISVFLLCWLLLRMRDLDFMTSLLTSLAVGFIGYFTISYLDTIWFENSSIPYLIDTVVAWGAVGAWLGWWLPRK